jgi:hypothetical protein
MPRKTSKLKVTEFGALADPAMAERMMQAAEASRLERVRADAERHPSRVLANALVNTAWRNGPVEGIHAGAHRGCALDRRRMTLAEERELMASRANDWRRGCPCVVASRRKSLRVPGRSRYSPTPWPNSCW